MDKKIIFGGSFDPPGKHHIRIIDTVFKTGHFREVIVVPCGKRKDKTYVDEEHRKNMAFLAFANIPNVRVELFNLENNTFTSNYDLEFRFQNEGEIWHLIGGDLVVPCVAGKSLVQQKWKKGNFIWENYNFLIITRPDFQTVARLLPKKSIIIETDIQGSSSEIRRRIKKRESVLNLVTPSIASYIEHHRLYW